MRHVVVLVVLLSLVAAVSAQGEEYVVQYGDVLDVIAASANASVACIAEASGLENPNILRPGDTLVIPADCPPYDGLFIMPETTADSTADSDADQGGGQASASADSYTVQYGDVLDLIAAQFNVGVACTAEASGIADPNKLRPGDVIVIDPTCAPYDGLFVPPPASADDADAAG